MLITALLEGRSHISQQHDSTTFVVGAPVARVELQQHQVEHIRRQVQQVCWGCLAMDYMCFLPSAHGSVSVSHQCRWRGCGCRPHVANGALLRRKHAVTARSAATVCIADFCCLLRCGRVEGVPTEARKIIQQIL